MAPLPSPRFPAPLLALLVSGCAPLGLPLDPAGDTAEPPTPDTGSVPESVPGPACPNPADLYDESCVVRYDVTITEADWQALQDTYDDATAGAWDSSRLDQTRPIVFTYGAETRDAGIHLKGNPATFLPGGKMQFKIDLNHVDPEAEFHGVTTLNLEAASYDPTGLKNGLALSVFRDAGLVASAGNFAALYVNGSFYAVYENIEQINGHFLQNHYADDSGNLYYFLWNGHYGDLRSNEDVGDVSRWTEMEDLVNATPSSVSLEEFAARIVTLVDVDELLLAFAAEAVIPQVDGVWAGSANCYIYDNPLGCGGIGCFEYLPWDLDSSFIAPPLDLCPACGSEPDTVHADPISFISGRGPAAKWRLYELLLQIPAWRTQFVDDLEQVLDRAYSPAVLQARHADRFAQIDALQAQDPKVDYPRFVASNEELAGFFAQREAFVRGWIETDRQGAVGGEGGSAGKRGGHDGRTSHRFAPAPGASYEHRAPPQASSWLDSTP